MEDAVTDCTAGHSHQFFKFMTLKKTIQDAIRATRPPCTHGTKPGRSTLAASRLGSSETPYMVKHEQIFSDTMMIMIGSLYRRPNQSNMKGTAGNSEGRMLYRLAEKRCKNFGTCRTNIAKVNKQILSLFISGKKSLEEGR